LRSLKREQTFLIGEAEEDEEEQLEAVAVVEEEALAVDVVSFSLILVARGFRGGRGSYFGYRGARRGGFNPYK